MGTYRQKLYHQLGLEPLRIRRWYRKLCLFNKVFKSEHPQYLSFYKAFKSEHPQYLSHLIPVRNSSHTSRNVHSIPIFIVKLVFSKKSFFPSTSSERKKLDSGIGNSEGLSIFRKNILHFIRSAPNSIYNCHNPKEVKSIKRLRLGLGRLREHKFKHNFQDSINPLCN